MIADSIANAARYAGLFPGLKAALEFLGSRDLTQQEPGRIEIAGDDCFALVQAYQTRPAAECKWESHRRYADVQFVAGGRERMGFAAEGALPVMKEYDPEKDQTVHEAGSDSMVLETGQFAVFYPGEAHMPMAAADGAAEVVKVVVKVRVP